MGMDHRHDVGSRLVDFTVDEAFQVAVGPVVPDGLAVEVVFDNVRGRHHAGRDGPRQVVAIRIARIADTDVAVRVENPDFVG